MTADNFRHHQERWNRICHSDALQEMQIPYQPIERQTPRSVLAEVRLGEVVLFAGCLVMPLLALAFVL